MCMLVYVGACGLLISNAVLYVANCSSWQRVFSRKARKDCKHQSSDRLFPSKGLTSRSDAMLTIFQRDLQLISQINNTCANQS